MGRAAEGWKIRRIGKGRLYYVRFRWQGHRPELATGEADPARAAIEAAKIYADVISGRRPLKPSELGPGALPPALLPVGELLAEWIAAIETLYAKRTVKLYKSHAFTHFWKIEGANADATGWAYLGEITTESIGAYTRKRLGQVSRESVKKERNTLKTFLSFCVEKGWLSGLPLFPKIPKSALGTRDPNRKEEATDLSAEEVERWLAALPELTSTPARKGVWQGKRFPVRDWFTLAWETGLRPATLGALEAPRHYQRGAGQLLLTKDIDKVRFGRPVPLTSRAQAILDRHTPEQGVIFGLSANDLRHYIEPAARLAGLSEAKIATFSPYDLRHARGTHLVGETGDLSGTAYLMGHLQLTTTNRYAKGRLRHAQGLVDRLDAAATSARDSGEDSGEDPSPKQAPAVAHPPIRRARKE